MISRILIHVLLVLPIVTGKDIDLKNLPLRMLSLEMSTELNIYW